MKNLSVVSQSCVLTHQMMRYGGSGSGLRDCFSSARSRAIWLGRGQKWRLTRYTMMHRYIFLYVIHNKHICASCHSHRIHTPRRLGSHTDPGTQRYIQQHEPLHTRSHQTETRGDKEMNNIFKNFYKRHRSLIMAGIVETLVWLLNQIPGSWHVTEGGIIIIAIMTFYYFELKENIDSIEEIQR